MSFPREVSICTIVRLLRRLVHGVLILTKKLFDYGVRAPARRGKAASPVITPTPYPTAMNCCSVHDWIYFLESFPATVECKVYCVSGK